MNEDSVLNIDKHNDPTRRKGRKAFEREFLDSICKKITNETIRNRMRYLLSWYDAKAQKNRFRYNLTRILTYFFPCVITLISIYSVLFKGSEFNWPALASATISVILTFTNHHIDHFRYYENWIRYRSAAEKLKRESQLFLNECGDYARSENDERIFANRIEKIVADEIAAWENLQHESYNSRPNGNQTVIADRPVPAPELEDIDIE